LAYLPDDYSSLTDDGKRLARIHVCKTQKTASDLVQAWDFFRRYYLAPPKKEGLYDPGWYSPPYAESCQAHYQLVWDVGAYPRNIQVFPRGFGKSKIMKELILLWAFTRPGFSIVLVKAVDDFITGDFQELMWQLEENELLLNDFGRLRPKRGKGIWSIGRLWLKNGFQLIGRSVLGKMLGLRPDFFAFDDAEFDPAMRVSPTLLTENVKYLYFNHVRPMMRRGTSVLLIGTMNTRKSFLYHGATVDEKDDPRFEYFNRNVCGAENNGKLIWEEYWNQETLAEMKKEMGTVEFNSMMLNEPGTDDERLLVLDPRYGYYKVSKEDEFLDTNPIISQAKLLSWQKTSSGPSLLERPYGETVSNMYRVLLADPIRNPSATSDWACAMVIGIERSNHYTDAWWILDIKLGKVKEPIFIKWLWELGQKWSVRVVGVEAVSIQKKLVEQVRCDFQINANEQGVWMPRVMPLTYAGDLRKSKSSRITGLSWRFETDKIKLPEHKLSRQGWRELQFQIDNFTEDLKLLPNDDAIDTLAMCQFVARPGGKYGKKQEAKVVSHMDMLEKGEKYFPGTKVPIWAAINSDELTDKALAAQEEARWKNRRITSRKRKRGRVRLGGYGI